MSGSDTNSFFLHQSSVTKPAKLNSGSQLFLKTVLSLIRWYRYKKIGFENQILAFLTLYNLITAKKCFVG